MTLPRPQSFDPAALEHLAVLIGDRYTWREMGPFFTDAGVTLPPKQDEDSAKWRYANRVLRQLQQGPNGLHRVAQVIERLCNPQSFLGRAEDHQRMVSDANEILSHYGLRVDRRSGKVLMDQTVTPEVRSASSPAAKTFDARQFHPTVCAHARELFIAGDHYHAVFECCKAFDVAVRTKAQSERHGAELMGTILSITGVLKLNAQQTESELNEQEGYKHLCMGLMRAIRNPVSHEPEKDWPMSQEDALDMLSLLSYLFRQLDKAVYFKTP
jgi:uncharacterized protein (TIGR02391 family)